MVSLAANLGFLSIFKYYNFFAESFTQAVSAFGWQPNDLTLNIILPVGISFYTFQTLSYTIDIYRRSFKPTTIVLSFFTTPIYTDTCKDEYWALEQIMKKEKVAYWNLTDSFRTHNSLDY